MPEVVCRRLDGIEDATVRESTHDLLSTLDPPLGTHVTIVPDVHYPFHPSSGMVTNPAAVAGALDWVAQTGRRPRLLAGVTAWENTQECLEYLGYSRLCSDHEIERVSPQEEPQDTHTVRVNGQEAILTAPTSTITDTLVMPTLRSTEDGTLVGSINRLAAAILQREPTRLESIATAAVTDAVGIMDASFCFAGRPHRSRALFASTDASAIDRFVATRPGWESDIARTVHPQPPPTRGIRSETLDAAIPVPRPISGQDASSILETGYRTYARATGDLVPPQLLEDV